MRLLVPIIALLCPYPYCLKSILCKTKAFVKSTENPKNPVYPGFNRSRNDIISQVTHIQLKLFIKGVILIGLVAILFDLDGTLLPMNKEEFLIQYFGAVTQKFTNITRPAKMKEYILDATTAMIQDTRQDKTNQEVFMEHFLPKIDYPPDELMDLFDVFYRNDFKALEVFTKPSPTARKVVDKLTLLGYRLVLATNPIFPREAILERMKWAGIENLPWELVTTYEESHFCKPNPSYYSEILSKMKIRGEHALMVGNDTLEDLVASKLGIRTYLVTDNLIDDGKSPWWPDYKGKLADLPKVLCKINKSAL